MAHRVAVLHQGRLEQISTPLELVRQPVNRLVAEFLGGSGNYLDGHVRGGPDIEDRFVAVETGLGVLRARLPEVALESKTNVSVLVRPECLTIADGKGDFVVKSVAYTGEVAEIEVIGPGCIELTVKELGISKFTPQQQVSVEVEPGSAVILSNEGPGQAGQA